MKNDLTCGVVQDLLPSYVEGLLGEESREAVERHLSACQVCAGKRDAMTAPAESPQESIREVDFLKRVKKRGRFRVFLAVLTTFAVLLGAAALKIFVIGTPLQAQTVFCDTTEEDGVLHLLIVSEGSGNAFHGWTVETEDGIACVYARSVLVGLYKSGSGSVEIPLSDGPDHQEIREVWVGGKSGKLVWQDGIAISPQAMVLLDAQSPYCGDPAALGRIAELLRLQEHLGSYTVSMKTSQTPYRWTLEFKNQLNEEQRAYMVRAAYLMLALTDNLDEVAYTVPEPEEGAPAYPNGFFTGESISAESAAQGVKDLTDKYNRTHFKANEQDDWSAKASVKDYARTPADFQRLLDILELL